MLDRFNSLCYNKDTEQEMIQYEILIRLTELRT